MPPVVYVTRKVHFSAAHYMRNPQWDADQNANYYGPCSRLHGHNYQLEVTVAGTTDPNTGYVIDLRTLKQILYEAIEKLLDHQLLNEVSILSDQVPSSENLIVALWQLIAPKLPPGVRLYRLRLQETPNNSFEYYGEHIEKF